MNKRVVVFICVLVFAISGVMAYDNMVTVSLDYGGLSSTKDLEDLLNFTGIQVGFYSYPNEHSSNGFYAQTSFQTMITDTPSNLFTGLLTNVLVGYSNRSELGKMFDLLIGAGASYQKLDEEVLGGALTGSSSVIGIGASFESSFLLSPKMTINGGVTAHIGMYDLNDRKVMEDIHLTVRLSLGVGFRF
ncbi:MAG: hypothetical protein EWM48_10240 [Sphaerochaeta sp.]|jgi:hypothetical protein|nr:MAG: hypothetical protein EWM48_10240 [Sphaerochaeta sp.]HPY45586.1 hypothetical protein [Sphaerochaeta sp.]HQB05217.1 hypothetical protein [Sphaerochaeta sp.]